MARILLLLLVWILRHTLGDIEQRFEQSDFRGRGVWFIPRRGFWNPPCKGIWYWNGRYYLYRNMFCLQCWVCCCIFNWIYFFHHRLMIFLNDKKMKSFKFRGFMTSSWLKFIKHKWSRWLLFFVVVLYKIMWERGGWDN